jgi:RNA polymerase sigma factor (sigma-70 family)
MRATLDAPFDTAIVDAAVGGDEAAFARIVGAYDDDLARVAYLVTGRIDLAQEAVQTAWPTAWRKLGQLRDASRLRPWLVAIAVNEARQLLRRRRRTSVREIAMETADGAAGIAEPNRTADESAVLLDLWSALERLDPDDREIVAMRYGLGLTSEEIATETGRSAAGVRSKLARALDRLRKDLGDA